MCTSIAWKNEDLYLGRNMDISFDFDRKIVIVPRNYTFNFKDMLSLNIHYAIMGAAMVLNDFPLFAEAVNEKGLYMAGLNFPKMASFNKRDITKDNITVNELIPYILSKSADVKEAEVLLSNLNITDTPFVEGLPVPELHFIISDSTTSLVIECTENGMSVTKNPTGIMTNNPTIDMHLHNLNNYMHLSNANPPNNMTSDLELEHYCMGLGALGLPGDYSSQSRFVKAYFLKANAVAEKNETASMLQMFHMLDAVAMVRGSVLDGEKYDITVYSCCINATKGIYYYKTYDSSAISAVYMHNEKLNGDELFVHPFSSNTQITAVN